MSVGVDEPRQRYLADTVDFDQALAVLFNPGIAQRLAGGADRNNLSADTEHSSFLDDSELVKFRTASEALVPGRGTQCDQLADVQQQNGRDRFC